MATVIKSGQRLVTGRAGKLPAFNFADVADRAGDYLQQVRREAAGILEQARREADSIRERAKQEGTQQALDVAAQQARTDLGQQLQTVLPAVRQLVDELKQSRQQWIRQWEDNVVHLAAAIAARMMRRQAIEEPQITVGLIREALQLAADCGEVVLHLNPADFETLQPQLEQLKSEFGKLAPTNVVPDPQITPAGCRVRTKFGAIDQQIEAQVARIEQELTSC
jgi:flagellar biosynthesis/type III secretory pathway protein FliH